MGLKDIGTLKLLHKLYVNYSTKGAEYKRVIIVIDKSIKFL
jgi:hypothetical protein